MSMSIRAVQSILLLFCLLSHHEAESRLLSREEDLEIEKKLKVMNKPAVKTIRTIHGDVYNCVDFYEQPAFDHPILKNHTSKFEIKSSLRPRKQIYVDGSSILNPRRIWLNRKGCPFGTVPIRKTTKDDLIRAKLASEMHASYDPQTIEIPGLHYAITRTKADPNRQYYGGGMYSSLYNPQVQDSQSSYARIKVQNGADYIEAGWMVNPTMYKDHRTRMYIYTNVGQSRCFNMFCPGFVQSAPHIPLDYAFDHISTRGYYGHRYSMAFKVDHDRGLGNWAFKLDDNETVVGFWYYKLLTTPLTDFATYIDWGGQVYGPPEVPSPAMGTGSELVEDTRFDAYFRRVIYTNKTNYMPVDGVVEEFADVDGYRVKDKGNVGNDFQHLFFYGGPGGHVGN